MVFTNFENKKALPLDWTYKQLFSQHSSAATGRHIKSIYSYYTFELQHLINWGYQYVCNIVLMAKKNQQLSSSCFSRKRENLCLQLFVHQSEFIPESTNTFDPYQLNFTKMVLIREICIKNDNFCFTSKFIPEVTLRRTRYSDYLMVF